MRSLAKALADNLVASGRQAAIVEQSRYERSVGTYHCSAGVEENMFENPSSVNWNELVKRISGIADCLAPKCTLECPGVVIIEGSLVLWIKQISDTLSRRIFLRSHGTSVSVDAKLRRFWQSLL